MSRKRVGVVLSGCGVYDGSEIHEATLTLYFLDRAGAEAVMMAPNENQHHVVDHLTGQESGETRNVLTESARIARGVIKDLAQVGAEDLDAVIMPGGFGAAKNLSNVAFKGPEATVQADLAALLTAMHGAGKPIGAVCISPAVVAKVLGDKGITLTIGNEDPGTAQAIEAMGATHAGAEVNAAVVDAANKIVSTPAYMCGATISQVGQGIEKLVDEVLKLA